MLKLLIFANADDVKAAADARELEDKMDETKEFGLKVVHWALRWELPTNEHCEILVVNSPFPCHPYPFQWGWTVNTTAGRLHPWDGFDKLRCNKSWRTWAWRG